jgi:NADH:flavin oxidoreductase/NADH oxidase family protein
MGDIAGGADVTTTRSTTALFTPFALSRLTLPNRIVMAPMTRSQSPDGVPDDNVVGYYRRRAEHGVGLIITEGTAIDHPAAVSSPRVPRFHGEDALAGWAKVLSAVHAAGGRIMPQLWHVGMARKPGSEPNPEAAPVGPSGLDLTGIPVNQALTETEVAQLIDAYAQGAADAERLGFDGIELHGAHGYLIDQFFWRRTNRRTDRYGGDFVARTRFAAEVIRACRLRVIADAKPSETELVRGYGADVVVARGERFSREVRAEAPGGVDALFDTETGEQCAGSFQVLFPGVDCGRNDGLLGCHDRLLDLHGDRLRSGNLSLERLRAVQEQLADLLRHLIGEDLLVPRFEAIQDRQRRRRG